MVCWGVSQHPCCNVSKPGPSLRTSKGFLEGPERMLLSWERPRKKVGPWAAGVERDQSAVCTGGWGQVGGCEGPWKHLIWGWRAADVWSDAIRFAVGRMEPWRWAWIRGQPRGRQWRGGVWQAQEKLRKGGPRGRCRQREGSGGMGEEGQRGSFRKPLPGLGGALEARGAEAWGEALSFATQIQGVVVSGGEATCSCRLAGKDSDLVCAGSVADEDSFLGNTADLEMGLRGMPAAIPRPSIRVHPCPSTPQMQVPLFSRMGSCTQCFICPGDAGSRC